MNGNNSKLVIPVAVIDEGIDGISGMESWFASNGLPWPKETNALLDEQGVQSVEDLRYVQPNAFDELFKNEKPVVRAKAAAALEKLVASTVARDVESQENGASEIPRVAKLAWASMVASLVGLVFGITSCIMGQKAYDCQGGYSPINYIDEWGNRVYAGSYYGDCEPDESEKAGEVAFGTGLTSTVLFAIATPLAFWVGRMYLRVKEREQRQGKRACPNMKCCPFNMALYGWIVFLGTLGWAIAYHVIVGDNYGYDSYGVLYASVVVPNFVAWGLIFAYSEMIRRSQEDLSLCC